MRTDSVTVKSAEYMLPILYSFRRCPYAIRARMAIKYSGISVELREVILRDKPEAMLKCSSKGEVPILQFPDGTVLDESMDIINWALSQHDPDNWLIKDKAENLKSQKIIEANDNRFKKYLDHYKYAVRFPEHPVEYYRDQACQFLDKLNNALGDTIFLSANHLTITDIAIFPFIRQFAFVDKAWFDNNQFRQLQVWLKIMLEMKLFADIMQKYPQWHPDDEAIKF